MWNKIILFSFGGLLLFSGCSSSLQNVEPAKIKQSIVIQKAKNEIFSMFNSKFHFKSQKKDSERPIYVIMYQNYK